MGRLAAIDRIVGDLLDGPQSQLAELRDAGCLSATADARLAAPLPQPRLIVCCGNTYPDHVREMRGAETSHLRGFIKNANAVIGPGEPIVLPALHPSRVDFEGELAFVVGRPCHAMTVDEARDCIAGFLVMNDVSARDWVEEARLTGNMFYNELGKQFPTFCPMGPHFVSADEVPDPHGLRLTTTVNGVEMQSASTGDLSCSVAEMLSFWSRWYRFAPGDVISTGSPPGVGAARNPPVYLRPGDTVAVTISACGTLVNPVVAAHGTGH